MKKREEKMKKNSELSCVVDVRHLPAKGFHGTLKADEQECQAIASRLRLIKVIDFSAEFDVAGNSVFEVKGNFMGHVVQPCRMTLEPVVQEVKGDFREFFAPIKTKDYDTALLNMDMEADEIEPLENDKIDVGELLIEYFSLSIPSYAEKEGAVHHFPFDDEALEKESPFAVLEKLKNKK